MNLSRFRFMGASLSRVVVGGVIGLALVTALVLWFWRLGDPRSVLGQGDSPEGAESMLLALPSPGAESGPAFDREERPERAGELKPGEVIDRQGFECGMTRGKGAAADLAVVTIVESTGVRDFSDRLSEAFSARFSVLDRTGALHTGELPFWPFQRKLGKSPYGLVVAGFGGINLQPSFTPLPAEGEHLRIFEGDALISEKDNVWLFDIADDGSSWFAVESLGTDFSSRLVISNLELGMEIHHDLGTMLAGPEGELTYLASWTLDGKEVHLRPAPTSMKEDDVGTHYFFRTDSNAPRREIVVPDRGVEDHALFVSSEEGFIFLEAANDNEKLRVARARFDWSSGVATAVWGMEGFAGTGARATRATPDGAWLLLSTYKARTARKWLRASDQMLFVLDTRTGENQFAFYTNNFSAKAQQLASVLPPQPTEDDVGLFNGAFFVGNDKLVLRHFPLKDGAVVDTERHYDIYDLNSITVDAQPQYRVKGNEHQFNPCASEGFPGTLRVSENGRLAYAALE